MYGRGNFCIGEEYIAHFQWRHSVHNGDTDESREENIPSSL